MAGEEAHLNKAIGRYSPEVGATARAALKTPHARFPGARQLVYERRQSLPIELRPDGARLGDILAGKRRRVYQGRSPLCDYPSRVRVAETCSALQRCYAGRPKSIIVRTHHFSK